MDVISHGKQSLLHSGISFMELGDKSTFCQFHVIINNIGIKLTGSISLYASDCLTFDKLSVVDLAPVGRRWSV